MHWAPFSYAVRRALGGRKQLEQLATRTWVVQEASSQWVPPAVHLPETLDRVTAPADFSTLAGQAELVAGGRLAHHPVRAASYDDAALVGGSLYVQGVRVPLAADAGFSFRQLREGASLSTATLGATYFGSLFFGHFWTDDVALMLLGQDRAPSLRPEPEPRGHRREILDLLGLDVRTHAGVHVGELTIYDDRGQTASKALRYQRIRRAFAEAFPAQGTPPLGAFIFRGSSGARRHLENEMELADRLVARGFVALHPERMSLAELSRALAGVRFVVGVEGSHLLHGIYTAALGASFVALQPPNRFGNVIRNYTDCLDMKYGFVVGEATADGFSIRPDELSRVLDLIDAAPLPGPHEPGTE